MPELDTLCGIAVLGVLFLHGFEWQYGGMRFGRLGTSFLRITQPGWIGVNLFFVLSGFLITGILYDSKDRPNYLQTFLLQANATNSSALLRAPYSPGALASVFARIS